MLVILLTEEDMLVLNDGGNNFWNAMAISKVFLRACDKLMFQLNKSPLDTNVIGGERDNIKQVRASV